MRIGTKWFLKVMLFIILGDFCYRNAKSIEEYLERLNGTIHLIIGNHDDDLLRDGSHLFASVSDIKEIVIETDKTIIMCHYPMREWKFAWRGAWHLFGHVHGHLEPWPHGFSLDVGVDCHDFRPIGVEQVRHFMRQRENPFVNRGDRSVKR